ncbi:MAG: hypothetical protein AAF652_06740, partial [Cyanobacteria bacterium P01_C01_bin.72]
SQQPAVQQPADMQQSQQQSRFHRWRATIGRQHDHVVIQLCAEPGSVLEQERPDHVAVITITRVDDLSRIDAVMDTEALIEKAIAIY